MFVLTSSNDPDIKKFTLQLSDLARQIQTLTLISHDQRDAHKQQNRFLTKKRRKVRQILDEFRAMLDPKLLLRASERFERSRLYVTAALLQFDMELFFIRWMAAEEWYEETGAYSSARGDIHKKIAELKRNLHRPGVRLAEPACHAIATDMRAWADKLSPEASTASGWLGAASDVSSDLRLCYHEYYTHELRLQRHYFRASVRNIYGLVSGYGLRSRRYVITVAALIGFFGIIFWGVDAVASCPQGSLTWQHAIEHALSSLAIFTTLGNFSAPVCASDGAAIQGIASVESLVGYIMLGVLISVFWMAFHESTTTVSSIRLPALPPQTSSPSAPLASQDNTSKVAMSSPKRN